MSQAWWSWIYVCVAAVWVSCVLTVVSVFRDMVEMTRGRRSGS